MSSGANTPDDLRNCPQSAGEDPALEDLSATQSSILYLLQEATKLATPSSQYSLGAEKLCYKQETISIPCNPTPSNQKIQNDSSQPSFTKALSALNTQTNSPWEVMSLINLQCERLLHCGQIHEEGDFYMSTYKADVVECSSVGLTERGAASVSSGGVPADHDAKSNVCCSVPYIIDGTDQLLSNQSVDEHNDIEDLAEFISKSTADMSDFINASVLSEESNGNRFLFETSVVPLDAKNIDATDPPLFRSPFHMQEGEMVIDVSKSAAPQTPVPEISSVDFTSSLVIEKDANSNLLFDFPTCENPEPHSAVVSQITPQSPQPDCASLSRTDLNNNLEDSKLQEPEEVSSTQSRRHNRRRTPRKQAHPARSPDPQDPELQGVTFSMQTEMDHSTDQCRLLITSNYSELCRRGRRGRSRSSRLRSLQSSQRTASSEEESDPTSVSKKVCASCHVRKTPLWRDAEDGTPLCNACGIRYKKYGVRCLQCWYIPRKEANSRCQKCGDLLQLAS